MNSGRYRDYGRTRMVERFFVHVWQNSQQEYTVVYDKDPKEGGLIIATGRRPLGGDRAYLRSLQPGDTVIETGSNCYHGCRGVVYLSENEMTLGSICVQWSDGMGTSATWGTRKITEHPRDSSDVLGERPDQI